MKMYCLVRRDLDRDYRGVQAGHAIAQYFLDHDRPINWDNGPMIYLGVEDENSLQKWKDKLSANGNKFSHFIEPDIGDELTVISIIDDGKQFSNLPLLR
jgi:hypothetical protein